MDLPKTVVCTPHRCAHDLLFQHKRTLLNVFRDVIGINQIDHISIACITHQHEILFLSHTPSIEYRLLTSSLWAYDLLHTAHFYTNTQAKDWFELYHPDHYLNLKDIKQTSSGLTTGFSIPTQPHGLCCVYSFGTKSKCPAPYFNAHSSQLDEFMRIGHYCWNALLTLVTPHLQLNRSTNPKSKARHLRLIVNNSSSSVQPMPLELNQD